MHADLEPHQGQPPRVPDARPLASVVVIGTFAVLSMVSFVELERSTGDGSTFTLGGPGLLVAIAFGLGKRWRSAWWAGLVIAVIGILISLVALGRDSSAGTVGMVLSIALLVLMRRGDVQLWHRAHTRTDAGVGAMLLSILLASVATSLLVNAT